MVLRFLKPLVSDFGFYNHPTFSMCWTAYLKCAVQKLWIYSL